MSRPFLKPHRCPRLDVEGGSLLSLLPSLLPSLLLLLLLLLTSGCGRSLCDFDGDGLCAPLDCDDYNVLLQQDCGLLPPTPSPTLPAELESPWPSPWPSPSLSLSPSPSPTDETPTLTPCPLYYADHDQDGFGNPSEPQQSCQALEGYVDNNLDCDDGAAYNQPGATELPDGVDNDCDGRIDEPPLAYRLHFQARYSELPDVKVSLWQGLDGTGNVVTSDENGDIWLLLEGPTLSFSYAYTRTVPALENGETQVVVVTRLHETLQPTTVYETGAALLPTAAPTGPYAVGGTIYGVADPYPTVTYRTDRSNDMLRFPTTSIIYALPFAYEYPAQPSYLFVTEMDNVIREDSPLEGLHYNVAYLPTTPTNLSLNRRFETPLTLVPAGIAANMTQSYHRVILTLPGLGDSLEFLNGSSALDDDTLFIPTLDGPLLGASLRLRAEYWNADGSSRQAAEVLWDGVSTALPVTLPELHTVEPYAPLEGDTLPGTTLQLNGESGDSGLVTFEERYQVVQTQPVWVRTWQVYQGDLTQPVIFSKLPSGASDWTLINRIPSAELTSRKTEGQRLHAHETDGWPQALTHQALITTATARQLQEASPSLSPSDSHPQRGR